MTTLPTQLLKLAPLNPILLRVVTAGGRRFRHALIRWLYLALLIGVLLFSFLATSTGPASLSELAKTSTRVFSLISYVQLAMICLLAPVFTAAAITQERDSRTYNILLSTPLSNAQIVIGSLFSRLFYIIALLLSGFPVFAITLFYGGVTAQNIALSFAIALSTGLFTGSLAIAIAVFRLGTSKTVFWFYVLNAVFLVGLFLIDLQIRPTASFATSSLGTGGTTYLTPIHPFLALESVVRPTDYPTPDLASLTHLPLLIRYYLAYPAYAYITLTLSFSALLVIPSAVVLRRIAQRSDGPSSLVQFLRKLLPNRESRKIRHVWSNPIAWREAATRAGLSARGLTRFLTLLLGTAGVFVLLYFYHHLTLSLADTRSWLVILVVVQFSVALLVATNTSASAVTRERESQTLDLLLVTPITSHYYIWGKLRGLVSFMFPFALIPTLTLLIVVLYDFASGRFFADPVLLPETLILLPLFLTSILAWACMLGLQLSLKWSKTLIAVMASLGVLAGIAAILGACGFAALNLPIAGLIFAPFSPFTGLCVLLDPLQFASKSIATATPAPSSTVDLNTARLILAPVYLAASALYLLLTWFMYRSMVKNFDLIIRRQHQ